VKVVTKSLLRDLYFESPAPIQEFIGYIHPKERLFRKYYSALDKSQWWKPTKLEELQVIKLKKILTHVYRNVPYYRRLFKERQLTPDDLNSIRDLEKLPILTKDTIRYKLKDLCAKDFRCYHPYLFYTGGSTGKPLKFYLDRNSWAWSKASVWRYQKWADYSPRDRCVIIRYRLFEEGKPPYALEGKRLYLSAFHMKDEYLSEYCRLMNNFEPSAIWSFPSALYVLVRYMKKKGLRNIIRPKAIMTTAETLFEHHRKEIEDFLNCKIYDWYGANETNVTACECPLGGMHINSECGILEVVDNKGENVRLGEIGKTVITDFTNLTMPLIRYELGDRLSLSKTLCPCGRGLPLIEFIEGRIDDIILTKDGRMVGRLDEAFHYSFGIKLSQIIQDKAGHILVKIVKDYNFSDEDIKILDIELRKRLGSDMDIDYEFVEDIPRTRMGKYKFVISKIWQRDSQKT